MSTPELETGSTRINGRWLSLELADNAQLYALLEQGKLPDTTKVIEECLPVPLTEISINIEQENTTAFESITGAVKFNTREASETLEHNWYTTVLNTVATRAIDAGIARDAHYIPHEFSCVYLEVNQTDSLRIEAESRFEECYLSLELINTADLYRALEQEEAIIDKEESNPLYKPYAAVEAALRTLVEMTDAVMATTNHAHQPPQPLRHSLRLTTQYDDTKQEITVPEITIPAIEQETNGLETLDTVGGATVAKTRLYELAAIAKNPQLARLYDVKMNHILLYGPTGTGKTSLARGFAGEIGAKLLEADSTDITTKWIGGSGKNMKAFFKKAQAIEGNVVMLIDEIDSIAPKGSTGTSERNDIKNVLKAQLEELTKYYPNIVFIGTTNVDLDDIDAPLRRAGRMEPILVGKPTTEERIDIWRTVWWRALIHYEPFNGAVPAKHGKDSQLDPYETEIDFAELARRSDGLTGADFTAILEKVREQKFLAAAATNMTPSNITQRDIEMAIARYTPVD